MINRFVRRYKLIKAERSFTLLAKVKQSLLEANQILIERGKEIKSTIKALEKEKEDSEANIAKNNNLIKEISRIA